MDCTALVIDDEEINIQLLRHVLEPQGYGPLTATTDSREALDLYRELQPDLVLLDLKMPYLHDRAQRPCVRAG